MKNKVGTIVNKLTEIGAGAVPVLTLAFFLPVLLCVILFGANMDYYYICKLPTLVPNVVLFLMALVAVVGWCFLCVLLRKKQMSVKQELCLDAVLLLLFTALYFLNVEIARNIAYYTGWDPGVVRSFGIAMANHQSMGYETYLNIYPNNIPISYVLGKLYIRAQENISYTYNADFLWIQTGCLFLSVAGFALCMTVKKLSKSFLATLLACLMYLACIGLTPWKIIPYTDMYAIVFPILCICFYVYYRKLQNTMGRYICLVLCYLTAGIGGVIKPTVYVVLIAILAVEVMSFLRNLRQYWLALVVQLVCVILLVVCTGRATDRMVEELGLEQNAEISATWHHYLYMGLNEETTGGYNSNDAAMFGEFQFEPASVRQQAEIERSIDRLQERGAVGTAYFWLRKMVMTFNDGTFGWGIGEAGNQGDYPVIASGGEWTQRLRDLFWPSSLYSGRYNTFCQLVWIFCLLGIPGICLCKREKRWELLVLTLSFLGVFLYLMLFESRARYLICFVPVVIAVSAMGMEQYTAWAASLYNRFKKERKN